MNSLKNIDTAFNFIKMIALVSITASIITCIAVITIGFNKVKEEKEKIYVLVNNQALEIALLKDVDVNRGAEIKSHSEKFHDLFFSLDPDKEMIDQNVNSALILAGKNVRQINSKRNENFFYHNLIKGGISTKIKVDSIKTDLTSYPYRVAYFGKQQIIRPSKIIIKNFISTFKVRNVKRTDNNAHGLFIENYKIVDHETLKSYDRK